MISGILIHLVEDAVLCDKTVAAIAEHPSVEIGDRSGLRLPAVIDIDNKNSAEKVNEWLMSLPGVSHVDVTFVHFEE